MYIMVNHYLIYCPDTNIQVIIGAQLLSWNPIRLNFTLVVTILTIGGMVDLLRGTFFLLSKKFFIVKHDLYFFNNMTIFLSLLKVSNNLFYSIEIRSHESWSNVDKIMHYIRMSIHKSKPSQIYSELPPRHISWYMAIQFSIYCMICLYRKRTFLKFI